MIMRNAVILIDQVRTEMERAATPGTPSSTRPCTARAPWC